MDREEFERIKQAEKEHLRKIKALKQQLREARRTASTRQALDRISGAGATPELDTSLEDLQREIIESEVRLDMALEAAAEKELDRKQEAGALPPLDDEEARKVRAAALVAQMKAALDPNGVLEADEPRAREPAADPEKTIGRAAGDEDGEDDAPSPLPEKTIGRVGGSRRRAE